MTRFQQVLAALATDDLNLRRDKAPEWARHVENRLNNAGLKVVEVYENKIGD